ncbi:SURF1 family protein [Simiduia sp. 21SJ11W-1]|uniref:SURF1 family protein n=1 Tax=Simiduia sp. 21SJ11W-1 TaxID=2909669 RepID=UPI00209E0C01|nr:SURF1 family protein [Simiduia sp. 21SJ11W-1]UTA47906.1 SURF1 family protein [Simiduia sp. 21SJ11W-1]
MSLALWQYDRGQEKKLLLSDIESRMVAAPKNISAFSKTDLQALKPYTQIAFTATADNTRPLLLDNQTLQGKVGYRVAQVVQLEQSWILVTRGWLPGSADRSQRPAVPSLTPGAQYVGRVAKPANHPLLNNAPLDEDFPMRFNQLNIESLSAQLDVPIAQWVELAPESYGALAVQWAGVNVSPAKHFGYAIQWLCMAVALLVLLVFANSNLAAVLRKKSPAKGGHTITAK